MVASYNLPIITITNIYHVNVNHTENNNNNIITTYNYVLY